jgi:hypothetical protein
MTSRSSAVAERHARALALARGERHDQVGKPRDQVDDAKSTDAAAHEVVGHNRMDRRPGRGEVIVLPELGPGQDDEQEADLEEERDEGKSADQN